MLLYNFHDYHLLVATYFIERMNLTLSLFLDIIHFHFLTAVMHKGILSISCIIYLRQIFLLNLGRTGTWKLFLGFSDPSAKMWLNCPEWAQVTLHTRYSFHQSFMGFKPWTI